MSAIGNCPREERLRRTTIVLLSLITCVAGVAWGDIWGDIWGDTVNIASRMESSAPTGEIQVSERAHARMQALYELEPRGPVEVRGRGEMSTWLLTGRRRGVSEGAFPAPKHRIDLAEEEAIRLRARWFGTPPDDRAA